MADKELSFKKGEKIIQAGEKEQRMYIIKRGDVEVSMTEDMKKVVLAKLKRDDFFGEMSLFNKTPRSADATALSDTIVVCIENQRELDKYLSENPRFSNQMVQILVSRLAKTNELLKKEMIGKSQATLTGFMW